MIKKFDELCTLQNLALDIKFYYYYHTYGFVYNKKVHILKTNHSLA